MALVTVRSPRWELEIDGPHQPTAGVMRGVDVEHGGWLRVSAESSDVEAEFVATDGTAEAWDPATENGPLLFEDTQYRLYAAGVNHAPAVLHRDPLFGRELASHARQKVVAGTFNVARQVGHMEFELVVGPEVVSIGLEVVPTKIDYRSDYRVLVDEVQSISRALALAVLRSTHQTAAHVDERGSTVEWLASLRQSLDELRSAVEYIARRPYRHLTRQVEHEPARRIRRPDSVVRRSILGRKGVGNLDNVRGIGPVRRNIPAVVARTTIDTPEHRWLAEQVRSIEQRLQRLATDLDRLEYRRRSDRVALRQQERKREVRDLARRVHLVGEVNVLAGASKLAQATPPSLTLMSAPGYREAYRILVSLRQALDLQGDVLELELKDLHDLYEIWCFLKVVEIASGLVNADPVANSVISTTTGGLNVGLRQGSRSDVRLPDGDRLLTLSYNRSYEGETGTHRPDIVLAVQSPGRAELIVALDAKYRVDASEAYRQRHGAPGPPIDAVNELHRYRDAIVAAHEGKVYRPTVKGVALFPLTVAETPAFVTDGALHHSVESLGIGALPFLPGNTELVRSWLDSLLSQLPDELEWNGPPGPAGLH